MRCYAPRVRFVEAFVNWDYQGIFLFTEKIKRDKNRVDIAKLKPDENHGDDLTGGYIIKIAYYNRSGDDSWVLKNFPEGQVENRVHFIYRKPAPDKITAE